MTALFLALLGAALVNNLVLVLPLGIDAALRAPIERLRLHGLGLATACVMLLAVPLNHLLDRHLLQPLGLTYLGLLVFLPLGFALIAPTLALLARIRPDLPLQDLQPLILLNGGTLGLVLLSRDASLAQTLVMALGGGLGFWLVLLLLADLLERIDQSAVPAPFRGAPLLLISLGLTGLAFLGFDGLDRP